MRRLSPARLHWLLPVGINLLLPTITNCFGVAPAAPGETPALRLRLNFAWTFAGNVVYGVSQWFVLIELAKLGSPELVGRFSLGLAVTAPLFIFTNLQLRSVQATDVHGEYAFADYLGLRLLGNLVALIGVAVVVAVTGYSLETTAVVLAIAAAKAFEAVSDIIYGLMQHRERMDRVAISLMLKGLISVITVGGAMIAARSAGWAGLAMAIGWLVVLMAYDLPNAESMLSSRRGKDSSLRPRWSRKLLLRLTVFSAPLGISMMLTTVSMNVPRYFIQAYLGPRELGIFSAMAYIVVAGTTVVTALGQAATPKLADYYGSGRRVAFQSLLWKLVAIGAAIGLVTVIASFWFGRQMLTIIYRPEYARRNDVFVWLMAAGGVSYIASFLGYGITATRAFRRFVAPSLISTALAIVSGFLIPRFGLTGAAWSTGVVSLGACAASLVVLRSVTGIEPLP
jgi:O-antigen/teichoic acid export membrane protein